MSNGENRSAATTNRFTAFIGDLGEKLMLNRRRLFKLKRSREDYFKNDGHTK